MTRRFTQVPCVANTRLPRGPPALSPAQGSPGAVRSIVVRAGLRSPPQAQRRDPVRGRGEPHAVNHTVSGIRVRPESMPASPRCAGDSRHTHPVPVTPDIGAPVASGWTVSSARIATTPIRIPVLFCPHARCRLPEPDRDQTRRQVHQAVTAPRRRQGCRAGAAVAGMLSPTRQPRAKAPARPVTPGQLGPGTHRRCHAHAGQAHLYRPGRAQAAIDRQRSCGNAAELAPDRCGQPKIARPDPPRATVVTGAHEGQC